MLLTQEFENLTNRYNFTQYETDLSAFMWAKAERAMQNKLTQEAVLLKEAPKFSTADIQAYYLGISKLPEDKVAAAVTTKTSKPKDVITSSEAQFMSAYLKGTLDLLEQDKAEMKIIADYWWRRCDGTEDTQSEFETLKRVLTIKERMKTQAKTLAGIQRKLKIIAGSNK